MTENEAIDKLNNLHYKILHSSFSSIVYESEIEALCMAKDVLQEIQQYRAIGTIEEFKDLKEKNTPKKPIRKLDINGKYEEVTCPNCGSFVDDYRNKKYCNCGQALDWQ